MNFLKQFFDLTLNNQETSSCQVQQPSSPQESGQFQIISLEEQSFTAIDSIKEGLFQNNENILCNCQSLDENNCTEQKWHPKHPKKADNDLIKQGQQKYLQQQRSKQQTIVQINPQTSQQRKGYGNASTIQLDQYYMIVSNEQLTQKFTTDYEWTQFYKKINQINQVQTISLSSSNAQPCSPLKLQIKKSLKISINIKQLNSILQLKLSEKQRRLQYWNNVAIPSIDIKFKNKELANKKDPKRLIQNTSNICSTLVQSILQQMKKKKIREIPSIEDQIEKYKIFFLRLLTFYGANDKQIGYSKGLEYVALGILVAKPFYPLESTQNSQQENNQENNQENLENKYEKQTQNITQKDSQYKQLQTHFKYFIFTKQLRNMYFPGTPKLYQQIHLLTSLMQTQVPLLYKKLQEHEIDFVKLFVNYYKTFLLFKITNPEVIRKIMELLIIYGIDVVRIVLTKIMSRNQKKLFERMQNQMDSMLKYMADELVKDYFGNSDCQQVILKFKQLFVLDNA